MPKRKSNEIRKSILQLLNDGNEHTYGEMERKINTNWQTVRMHCQDLVMFNAAVISVDGVKITKEGRDVLKKFQKASNP